MSAERDDAEIREQYQHLRQQDKRLRTPLGPIKIPTLYIWGDADDTVGRAAAEGTRDFVSGPYRFKILPGVGHFIADQAPDRLNALLLAHLARHPA